MLRQLAPAGIAVSRVSVAELYEGAFATTNSSAHLAMLRIFLRPYPIVEFDDAVAERFAQIRFLLRRRGQTVADLDLLIAATALVHNLTLLTFNARHFSRVPGIQIYSPPTASR